MRYEDIEAKPGGVLVKSLRSKTNQAGEPEYVGIPRRPGPTCPVRALEDWCVAAGIESGPVFSRSPAGTRRVPCGAKTSPSVWPRLQNRRDCRGFGAATRCAAAS